MSTQSTATFERVPFFDAIGAAARKKLNAPDGWEWYSVKVIGDAGDVLVEGGVPVAGKKEPARWRGVKGQTVVVTRSEVGAARAEYERETGACGNCAGSGKTLKSLSVKDGATYRECVHCGGSGTPSKAAP